MDTLGRSKTLNTARCMLVIVFATVVAIDALPDRWMANSSIRRNTRSGLGWLGLAQGEWSLFAPNPAMRKGYLVGEVKDHEGNTAVWKSPDWSEESVTNKFLRFRHLNYYQRVVLHPGASIDLADYLHRSIPDRETVQPGVRWTEELTLAPSAPLVPPVGQVILYHHHPLINLAYEEPIPDRSDMVISETDRFLVKQDYPK